MDKFITIYFGVKLNDIDIFIFLNKQRWLGDTPKTHATRVRTRRTKKKPLALPLSHTWRTDYIDNVIIFIIKSIHVLFHGYRIIRMSIEVRVLDAHSRLVKIKRKIIYNLKSKHT